MADLLDGVITAITNECSHGEWAATDEPPSECCTACNTMIKNVLQVVDHLREDYDGAVRELHLAGEDTRRLMTVSTTLKADLERATRQLCQEVAHCGEFQSQVAQLRALKAELNEWMKSATDFLNSYAVAQARVDELEAALRIIVEPGCYDSGTCTTSNPDPVSWCSSCIASAVLAKGATTESEAPCTACGHLFATHLDLGRPTRCAACDCTGYMSVTTESEAP